MKTMNDTIAIWEVEQLVRKAMSKNLTVTANKSHEVIFIKEKDDCYTTTLIVDCYDNKYYSMTVSVDDGRTEFEITEKDFLKFKSLAIEVEEYEHQKVISGFRRLLVDEHTQIYTIDDLNDEE